MNNLTNYELYELLKPLNMFKLFLNDFRLYDICDPKT